mmetsp:Transcript_30449/g.43650  ORF Transcript_30449/g.43650 Transcript_30449/m.43650 type:complete len:95 (+) Transcript_30449:164-448(+)
MSRASVLLSLLLLHAVLLWSLLSSSGFSHSRSLDLVGCVMELGGGGGGEDSAKVTVRSFGLLEMIFYNVTCIQMIVRQGEVFCHTKVECFNISG